MSRLFDEKFLRTIQQLTLSAHLSIEGSTAGSRKSRSKGSSVEFSDYREYIPGDDFRRIDWNAFGRFEKLFVKLFMEEREAPVNIFLDVSRSMDWGEPNKNIASRRLAAALAYISLANFDRVSVVCFDDGIQKMCRNVRGKNLFHTITDILENVSYTGRSSILKSIESLYMQTERGITVIISDFFSGENLSDILKYLVYNKQSVYICHILSPQEIRPVINESVKLVDSETMETVEITITPAIINSYCKVLDNFKKQMERSCIKWGAYYFSFSSDMDVAEMVKEVAKR